MAPWHRDHQRLCKLLYFALTEILDTYVVDCSSVLTSMIPNTHLSAKDYPTTPASIQTDSSIPTSMQWGVLMYLATSTRLCQPQKHVAAIEAAKEAI